MQTQVKISKYTSAIRPYRVTTQRRIKRYDRIITVPTQMRVERRIHFIKRVSYYSPSWRFANSDNNAELPHSLSNEEEGLPAKIREGVTQSLIDCILTGQSTGAAIYSFHLARWEIRPAENTYARKSGQAFQPRYYYPRQNQYGENPTLSCPAENLSGENLVWQIIRLSNSAVAASN